MKIFGRYSDINKSKQQLADWNDACELFENKNYLEAFQKLLNYIQNDNSPTVEYQLDGSVINFKVSHNFLTLKGEFTTEEMVVSLHIATLNQKPLPLMRKILSLNYEHNYSRFLIVENQLVLKGNLSQVEYNPYTIYNLIQEVALKGDLAVNGILIEKARGDQLEGVELSLKKPSDDFELTLEHKWNLLNDWITKTLTRSKEISSKAIAGGASYLLLNLAYRIDYFLNPTGPLQLSIEKINNDFFADDNLLAEEKNKKLIETYQFILNKLSQFSKQYLFTNFPYSFSFTSSTKMDAIISHFAKSLDNYIWYQENNYSDIALECFEYGVLYNTFNYKIPEVLEELFEMFLVILNSQRIQTLKYPVEFYSNELKFLIKPKFLGIFGKEEKSHFNIQLIQNKIQQINNRYKVQYPKFQFRWENLVFDNLLSFAISFTKELNACDFNTYNSTP